MKRVQGKFCHIIRGDCCDGATLFAYDAFPISFAMLCSAYISCFSAIIYSEVYNIQLLIFLVGRFAINTEFFEKLQSVLQVVIILVITVVTVAMAQLYLDTMHRICDALLSFYFSF